MWTSTANQPSGMYANFDPLKILRSILGMTWQYSSQTNLRTLIFGQCKYHVLTKNRKVSQQSACLAHTISPGIESTLCESFINRGHHCAIGVLPIFLLSWNFVIYRNDRLSIKFCHNDSFRKLFLFLKINFQYRISQDISVSHFDSRRSLNSANRRRSTSPILFPALLSLVISMTGRSKRSARALRDGADVVREAIGY